LDSLYNYKNVTVIRATKPNIYNNSLRNLGLDSDSKKYLSSRDLFYQDSIYVRSGSTNEILIVTPLNQSKTIVIDSAGKYSQTLLIDGTTLITGNATKNFTSVLDTTLIFSEYYSQDSMGSVYRISGEQFRGNDGGAYGLDNHAQVLTKIGRRCDFIELDNNISSINDTLTTNSGGVYQWVNCANNFAPIVGETNQHFEPTTSGNYAVVMYKSGCKDTSECVNFNTLGFNKSYENSEFQFYPNPTTGWLYIETENYTTITIQDLNGKILQTQDVDKQGQIDISSFSSGMYLLRTKEGLTRKFIKE
jgi:hypothetical protein